MRVMVSKEVSALVNDFLPYMVWDNNLPGWKLKEDAPEEIRNKKKAWDTAWEKARAS